MRRTIHARVNGKAASRPMRSVETNPYRQQLMRILDELPGLNVDEISHELGLSRSPTIHHLRQLNGKVVALRQGRHLLHFPADLPPKRCKALALLRVQSIRSLVGDLMEDPRVLPAAFASKHGISKRSVFRSINMLVEARLACEQEDPAPRKRKVNKRARRIALDPEVKIAWTLWCKDADTPPSTPLHKSPGWLFLLDVFIGKLILDWGQVVPRIDLK